MCECLYVVYTVCALCISICMASCVEPRFEPPHSEGDNINTVSQEMSDFARPLRDDTAVG